MDRSPQPGLETAAENARNKVDAVYRSDSRHVLATLIRLLGDFDIAEEALHDAFRAALEQWPRDGVPAKTKIRNARIPYEVPAAIDLPDRLDAVLRVVYLVFNEGYYASSGAALTRHDLSSEAISLGRLLVELLPEPEALGLLALMLLHDSRRAARTSPSGELILLNDQDRLLWNRDQISEGMAVVEQALAARDIGPYSIQAAIAAVHASALNAA